MATYVLLYLSANLLKQRYSDSVLVNMNYICLMKRTLHLIYAHFERITTFL